MKTEDLLVSRIVEFIQNEGLAAGQHLPAQMLAEQLKVSRSPINAALKRLYTKGVLTHKKNRGYFVSSALTIEQIQALNDQQRTRQHPVNRAYFQMADDLLAGQLSQVVTETELRARYALSHQQLNTVLNRIQAEGWINRRPGYGWEFSSMMMTPEALLQSYRLRLALEPAALLEPGYDIAPAVIERCRAAEWQLLEGGIETASADELHDRGVYFHESIVEASGNPFFIETIRRVNQVRRLLSYRSMRDRQRYQQHCQQHLQILDLLAQKRNQEASVALQQHLQLTLDNLTKIQAVLKK